MKNLPEFKALIERYESVTIEEIENNWVENNWVDYNPDDYDAKTTANILTGHGSIATCTLCKAVNADCNYCVWFLTKCICCTGNNAYTYESIEESPSPTAMLTAFRARAAYMRQVLKDGGIE